MGKFGWSYPAGCSGPPEEPDIDPRVEEIWGILERAGVSEETIEQVNEIAEQLAIDADKNRECPRCIERWIKEEQQAEKDLEKYWDEMGSHYSEVKE
jgi:hypothetical protein